jgi:hypothetical protein
LAVTALVSTTTVDDETAITTKTAGSAEGISKWLVGGHLLRICGEEGKKREQG